MDTRTGNIQHFEKPQDVPKGWVPLPRVGEFINATINGHPLVFVVRKITKKDIVIRLRVNETAEARSTK